MPPPPRGYEISVLNRHLTKQSYSFSSLRTSKMTRKCAVEAVGQALTVAHHALASVEPAFDHTLVTRLKISSMNTRVEIYILICTLKHPRIRSDIFFLCYFGSPGSK